MQKCDGPCGRELPRNFLKPLEIDKGHGQIETYYVCQDCRRHFKNQLVKTAAK